jgi:hypothetical protein
MNFIVAWFMMIVHFLGHFFFLDGLRVWSERVECPCPVKKVVVRDEESGFDKDLRLNAVTSAKEEKEFYNAKEPEVCYCKLSDEDKKDEDKAVGSKAMTEESASQDTL